MVTSYNLIRIMNILDRNELNKAYVCLNFIIKEGYTDCYCVKLKKWNYFINRKLYTWWKSSLDNKRISEYQIKTTFDVSFPNKEYSCFGINKLSKKVKYIGTVNCKNGKFINLYWYHNRYSRVYRSFNDLFRCIIFSYKIFNIYPKKESR